MDVEGNHPTLMFGDTIWADINTATSIVTDLDNDDPAHIFMPLLVPSGLYALPRRCDDR